MQTQTDGEALGERSDPALRVTRLDAEPEGHGTIGRRDLVALGGLVVLLAFLWGRGRGVWFWVDEGMSVGIASHPLSDIPGILRQDGSPPLYYLLLGGWTRVFGSSEAATHILSLLPALAAVPAALWAGWSLVGRRTGWIFAVLIALNPFVAYYANETRMYSLVILLSLLATATFVHAFVFDRPRYLPPFVLATAALVYTHNWGLFFALGTGVAALGCALMSPDRRRVLLRTTFAFGAVGLLYLPWVPTLLAQIAHTRAPFSLHPTLERIRDDIVKLLGTHDGVVALGLGAGTAMVVLLRRPWDRLATTVLAVAAIPTVVVVVGWLLSRQESVWQARYLAVIVAPIALVLAVGLAHGGRIAIAGLVVYGFLAAPIAVKRLPSQKSDVRLVAQQLGPELHPGDVVVADFGRVPLVAHYFPPGLRYAEPTGPVADPLVSDQRDGTERLRRIDPSVALAPLLDELAVGGHVVVICPPMNWLKVDDTEFVHLIYNRCQQTRDIMRADPRFEVARTIEPHPEVATDHAPSVADLLTKVASS